MHPSSMHSFTSITEEPELTVDDAEMAEDVHLHSREDADETMTVSSQASQSIDPDQEVSIWCDENEVQNERRL